MLIYRYQQLPHFHVPLDLFVCRMNKRLNVEHNLHK